MIVLTRLNGEPIALNPDRIERADSTPDTVITMVDGSRYVVSQSIDEITDLLVGFKAAVRLRASQLAGSTSQQADSAQLRLLNTSGTVPTPQPTETGYDA